MMWRQPSFSYIDEIEPGHKSTGNMSEDEKLLFKRTPVARKILSVAKKQQRLDDRRAFVERNKGKKP